MRKIIIIIVSIIFVILGILFIREINDTLNDDYITQDGEITFEYSKITSINMPTSETKIITSLDDLKPIVEQHNFNIKHSYIYVRLNADNKHNYKITNVIKNPTQINIVIQQSDMPENINLELIETTTEYIIDLTGVLKDKTLPVIINYIDDTGNAITT